MHRIARVARRVTLRRDVRRRLRHLGWTLDERGSVRGLVFTVCMVVFAVVSIARLFLGNGFAR